MKVQTADLIHAVDLSFRKKQFYFTLHRGYDADTLHAVF